MADITPTPDSEPASNGSSQRQPPKYRTTSQEVVREVNPTPLLISLGLSLISCIVVFWLPGAGVISSIAAVILGHKAHRTMKSIDGGGNVAGIVFGYIALVWSLLIGFIIVLLVVAEKTFDHITSTL